MADPPGLVVAFTIPGTPQQQGSKVFSKGGFGYEANKNLAPWRKVALSCARDAKVAIPGAEDGAPLFTGPVQVTMVAYFPRPASHFGSGRNAGPAEGRRADVALLRTRLRQGLPGARRHAHAGRDRPRRPADRGMGRIEGVRRPADGGHRHLRRGDPADAVPPRRRPPGRGRAAPMNCARSLVLNDYRHPGRDQYPGPPTVLVVRPDATTSQSAPSATEYPRLGRLPL